MAGNDAELLTGPSGSTPVLNLPYPTPDDSVDVPRDVQALATALDAMQFVPVGAMFMFPGAAAPNGYLMMIGQVVPASAYPGLAAILGQDASANVTIPDMRDRFPIGASPTLGLNAIGGEASHALTVAEMPSHSHNGATGSGAAPDHYHAGSGSHAFLMNYGTTFLASGSGWGYANVTGNADRSLAHTHTIPTQGGNTAHENRPPFRAVNFIIRAG